MSISWLAVVNGFLITCFIIQICYMSTTERNGRIHSSSDSRPILEYTRILATRMQKKWQEVVMSDRFQTIDAHVKQAYVYSAYLDDRQTPDTTSWRSMGMTHVIRIFAWFQRQQPPPIADRMWQCVFWNDRFEVTNIANVTGFTDTDYGDQQSQIVRAMLLCPYNPDNCTSGTTPCPSPFAVSVVTSPTYREPVNILPVVDLPARRTRFFSTGSRATPMSEASSSRNTSKTSISFAMCPKPLFLMNPPITVDDMIQFIEVNRVFGAELFFFYIDESIDPRVLRCLQEYERLGGVELTPWKLPADLENIVAVKGQFLALTECGYRLMYRTKHLLTVDIDEFIVPTRTDDWMSMLRLIDAESKDGNGDRIASYNFRNRFFRLNTPVVEPPGLNLPANWSDRFPILTRIAGETKLLPWIERSKTLGPPERILVLHNHLVHDHQVVPPGEINLFVDEKDGVLHHYRKIPIISSDLANYTRMWNFTSKIFARLKSGSDLMRFV